MSDNIAILGDLIRSLKDGGAYAGWAITLLMWYYERRANRKSSKDIFDITVSKIRADVKTENSITSLTEAINSLGVRIEVITSDIKGFKHKLKSCGFSNKKTGE